MPGPAPRAVQARAASVLPELDEDDAVLPADGGRGPGMLAGLAGLLNRRGAGHDAARDGWQEPVVQGAALQSLRARIAAFEPSRRVGFVLLFLAVTIWNPWLIPGLMFLGLWIGLIVYFTLGPERITELSLVFWDWYARRHPERAQVWLGRVQRAADRIDGWLARLPERWTDGIYLPDFGRSQIEESSEVREEMGRDPYERLRQQDEAGAQAPRNGQGAMLRS
ncbi:MAG: hypothetical protein R3D85_11220 [Paracoccaceae bacterium]